METQTNIIETQPKQARITRLLKRLGIKIAGLFEPEEVEVTFKMDGEQMKYTYTKVEHKQVA